ncbi:MAG: YfjI family protein [Macromonas bipunctata]|nr:YfjI family protein [Macromonas bipunctata]
MARSETFPDLPADLDGSDFNDLTSAHGTTTVADAINAALSGGATPPDADPAPAEDWPDPVLPGTGKTPDIPAHLLPGVFGEYAAAVAANTQTPPAMSVLFALAVLGTVLQRSFEVAPYGDSYTEPLSLWTNTAAASASRKTAVMGAWLAPLVHWEKVQRDRMRTEIARVNARRAVAEKRIEKLRQDAAKASNDKERHEITAEIEREEVEMPDPVQAPRLFTGDTTLERLQTLLVENHERMAVLSDEGGIFKIMAGLYSGGAANIDVALQGHAGSPLRVDRAGRSAYCDKPAVSFGLLLQPDVWSEVASSRGFRSSGLLARFLFAVPESLVGKRDVRKRHHIPPELKDAYEKRLFQLLEARMNTKTEAPTVLEFSDSAREMWLDFAQAIEDGQGAGRQFDGITDWTGKLPGAVARIAALMELADVGLQAETVHEVSMQKAIELAWLLVEHARAAFGLLGADEQDGDAAAVLRWIKAQGEPEFSQRDAQKAMEGRFRNVKRLVEAMERLETSHVVRRYMQRNKGARPSIRYAVNPACLSS